MKKTIITLIAGLTFTANVHAQSWNDGGNAFGATGTFGTTDNNHINFMSNNNNRGRLTNNGNFLLGTTTDNSTGVLQVNGTSSFYGDINLKSTGPLYIKANTNNYLQMATGTQDFIMSVDGTNGGDYVGLKINNPTYSTNYGSALYHNAIRVIGFSAHFAGQGSGDYYLKYNLNAGGNSNLTLGNSLSHGMDIIIRAEDGNGLDCAQGNAGSVKIDPGHVQGICSTYADGKVLIGSVRNTKVGINTSSPAYELDVNGDISCVSLFQTSDARYKTNIGEVSNASEKLFQLTPHTYSFMETKDRIFDKKNHFGFIAQEVEKVYPELVSKNAEGYYAVNYTEFIPLLLQSLKEEDQKINELSNKLASKDAEIAAMQERLSSLENKLQGCCANNTKLDNINNVRSTLEQNKPNPFSSETIIGFNIVENYSQAFIGIYDMSGKEINRIRVSKDMKEVTLSSHELVSGLYMYGLIIDGNVIDMKKMVIAH